MTLAAKTYLVPDTVWRKAEKAVAQGRVRSWRIGNRSVYGTVLASDNERIHTPLVACGFWSCTCEGAAAGQPCYHIAAVLQSMGLRAVVSFLVRPKREAAA